MIYNKEEFRRGIAVKPHSCEQKVLGSNLTSTMDSLGQGCISH